ncbi:MAG: hypothetical protein IJ688_07815 [Treponema sp.]|nr:hypothetical protein [Treponema sp.]
MFEYARAICYSGYRRNQSPVDATYPSYEEIAEDLQILVNLGFKYIRMYDAVEYARRTCQVIRDKGFDLKLMLGPGIRSEINNAGCPWLKVTYSPEQLAKHLDIISVHSYPLWYGNTVEEALDVNKEWYKKICDLYPDKPVLFSEVGWATSAVDFSQMKQGQPNEENQKKYYDAFWEWTDKEKIISYMFEAFDEPWKGGSDPNEAEKHWGIFDVDRKPKLLLK